MHYIGMLACILPVPVAYHWPTVLLSLFAAVLASAIALYVVEPAEDGCVPSVRRSILMGGGIASMHYIGMAAMRMSAISHYDSFLVVLSVVFAVLISLAALRITFHLRDEKAATGWRKTVGAVVIGRRDPRYALHWHGRRPFYALRHASGPGSRHKHLNTRQPLESPPSLYRPRVGFADVLGG